MCDIVIANAGVADSAPLYGTSLAQWHHILSVNLTGCFLTLRGGLQKMREAGAGWGRLIAISSISGLAGYRYGSLQRLETWCERACQGDSGTGRKRHHRKRPVPRLSGH